MNQSFSKFFINIDMFFYLLDYKKLIDWFNEKRTYFFKMIHVIGEIILCLFQMVTLPECLFVIVSFLFVPKLYNLPHQLLL